jgi:nitroimidazol reductase NimA-like FMN-containing flavoprotein (pyridoxamine 5'-phosphate oxidase superfamily)
MSDRPPDEPPGPPSVPDPAPDAATNPASDPGRNVERRAFLRQLTGDAVVTTARLAGLSSAVRRSLFAAGDAATRDLGPSAVVPMSTPTTPLLPPSEPAPTVTLTPRQDEFLTRALTAVLGINDPAGAPHLTSSIFHWDGTTVRLPSELLGARAARIDGDPRVSVLVKDESSEAWVAMTGLASVVSGDAVEAEMLTILGKYVAEDEAEQTWTEMRSSGERVVIGVRPTRFVWRLD